MTLWLWTSDYCFSSFFKELKACVRRGRQCAVCEKPSHRLDSWIPGPGDRGAGGPDPPEAISPSIQPLPPRRSFIHGGAGIRCLEVHNLLPELKQHPLFRCPRLPRLQRSQACRTEKAGPLIRCGSSRELRVQAGAMETQKRKPHEVNRKTPRWGPLIRRRRLRARAPGDLSSWGPG